MSAGYANRLKEFPNKGVCGLPEQKETQRSYALKRKQLCDLIKQAAGHVVVLTGAGVSTSAGIPDFRGPKGIWTLEKQKEKAQKQPQNGVRKRKREKRDNRTDGTEGNDDRNENDSFAMDFSQAHPTLTHRALYYLTENHVEIRNNNDAAQTNTELLPSQNEDPLITFCVTQNVDGLHRRSGMRRERLSILHGCVFTEKCQACGLEHFCNTDVGGMSFGVTGRFCSDCQQPLRDTLLDWQDPLPEDDHDRAIEACDRAELVLCLGTSLRIEPAGSLPTRAKKYVIVNLQETPYDAGAALLVRAKVDRVMRDLMHDLGLKDEALWNTPASISKIQRTWRNPGASAEFLRSWWKIPELGELEEEEEDGEGNNVSDEEPVSI